MLNFNSLPLHIQEGFTQHPNLLAVVELRLLGLDTLYFWQWQALAAVIANCKNLHTLNLANNNLHSFSAEQWYALRSVLSNCTNLQSISLAGNDLCQLTEIQWQGLGDAIASTTLQTIDLCSNDLDNISTVDEWLAMSNAMAQCPALNNMILRGNNLYNFETEQWQGLGAVFAKCCNLQNIDVNGNYLDDFSTEQWQNFSSTLNNAAHIKSIQAPIEELKQVLYSNGICKVLDFIYNEKDAILTRGAHKHLDFRRTVLCFLAQSIKPGSWQQYRAFVQSNPNSARNLPFIQNNLYEKLAPYLDSGDAQNMYYAMMLKVNTGAKRFKPCKQ